MQKQCTIRELIAAMQCGMDAFESGVKQNNPFRYATKKRSAWDYGFWRRMRRYHRSGQFRAAIAEGKARAGVTA